MRKVKFVLYVALATFLGFFTLNLNEAQAAGHTNQPATYSVPSQLDFMTVRSNLLKLIKEKGLTHFAEFDHGKNAKEVDLQLEPTTVIVFGNAAVGTKLLEAYEGIGLELPLRMLIAERDGKVTITYPNLFYSFMPYGIQAEHPIATKMQGLLKALAEGAAK